MQSLSWEVPWLTYGQSQSVAAIEFISQCFDHSAHVLDQGATEPLFFSIIPATAVRCGLFSEAPSTQSCKYWVGKKVNLGFSVMAYGKPWTNFLVTPFFLSASKNSRGKFLLYLWLMSQCCSSLHLKDFQVSLRWAYTGFLWPWTGHPCAVNKLRVWTAQFEVPWFSGTAKAYSVFLGLQESFHEFLGRTLFCYY